MDEAFCSERSRVQAAIVSCLRRAGGRLVSADYLLQWVYANDPDGGAEQGPQTLSRAIAKLRARGVPISNHFGRGYSLAPLA